MKPRILFLITLLCAAIAQVQIVHAAEISVTNTNDSGAGSLRQALASAHDGDTIVLGVTGTITLTTGQLEVNKILTITGFFGDPSLLAISGNHASRVFRIFPMPPDRTVTISGVTITNGTSSDNDGGGIYNDQATLILSNCILSGNSTPFGHGGGIYNNHATLTIDSCTVSGNSGNPGLNGGGIYNDHSTLTIINSTLSGNSTTFGRGGGIFNDHSMLTVSNSILSGNSAALSGGGIENHGEDSGSATLTIINSTLSGNSASQGGGIRNTGQHSGSATLTITNSTLSGNSAPFGGGIANTGFDAGTATLTLGATILNTGASGKNIENDQGTVTSLGYNLSSDAAGGDTTTGPGGRLNQPGDIRNTIPMLDPAGLQNNGGPTQTIALMPGSPAIDKGKNFSGSTLDQRGTGFVRTSDDPAIMDADDGTDIGAFEVQWIPGPAYAAQVQQPIDADGTSVFNVKRGVVPVKFTLTLDGVATCALPPATIAVTRTAGGTTGPVDESVYTGPADNGSFFRIDGCQYIYNLSASALAKGTYQVDIMINTQVVGSAVFQLK
jgi:hypothetical protein